MTLPHYDDVRDVPLITDEEVLERASLILGHAVRRQLWFMFLDEEGRQLPLLMPSYLPRRPSPVHRENYSRVLEQLVEDAEAGSIVVALERRGSDELTEFDREWLALLREACAEAVIPMRGPILVHDDGLRWIAAEDIS